MNKSLLISLEWNIVLISLPINSPFCTLSLTSKQLDITGENYISPEDLRQPLMHTEVEKVAFDLSGDWMATVERRDDKQTSPEMRLKFWEFDKSKQR